MNRLAGARAAAAFLLGGVVVAGCSSDPSEGYSFSPLHSDSYRTISVPIFENLTFNHDLEIQLTEAVVKEIQRRTGWAVVRSDQADTTLTGTITDWRLHTLTTKRNSSLVQEQGVELTVDFDWRDNRSGEPLVSRRKFSGVEAFVPARPAGEHLEVGKASVIQHLARDIVSELRTAW